ncbi:hypothetical protein N0B31_09060 [Salinirubellus salinus]|uniref:Uncharacterized protein n=1 Tax=Salinirubellus salinus TaxID=1364945 RepID=A0A9E7R6M2_9EURY|nr:hypothetical protein [Salinirubellus salinus]UWM56426.1 hypothetical protein N0B31_09060 [Salinirubellus salinus]
MVKRRKVLIGAGALFAGSSAAVGTGALSQASVDRGISGRIANDTNGYVSLKKGFDNGDHVSFGEGGELSLNFGNLGADGAGLNADSINYFDSVFRVEINDDDEGPTGEYQSEDGEPTMNEPENYYFWVTENLGQYNDNIDFYRAGGRQSSIVGPENAQQPNSDNAGFWVGVCIDLDDEGFDAGDAFDIEDAFTVHVSDKPPETDS